MPEKKHGKRYNELAKKIDRLREYPPEEGVKLVKETSGAKFDTTVELHMRMGVDPKHADQMVRGAAVLPNGTGKTVRVIAFAQGDKAREAQAAGADVVGAEDLAKRIEGGWMEFDVAVATPDLMGQVGKLGRVLGPRGLMPNPKSGTVTFDVGKAVRDAKGGRVEFRVDKTAVIHTVVGKASFSEQALVENLATVIEAINRARPAGVKGQYVRSAHLTSTQGPSVKLDLGATLGLGGRATA
ncbi:MAG: 50S ribosomal protein L1 [Chloroflexi bacterium]|nr:MAG: 50S ribosomal protein L1 [Chloroflexota bacterium]